MGKAPTAEARTEAATLAFLLPCHPASDGAAPARALTWQENMMLRLVLSAVLLMLLGLSVFLLHIFPSAQSFLNTFGVDVLAITGLVAVLAAIVRFPEWVSSLVVPPSAMVWLRRSLSRTPQEEEDRYLERAPPTP